MVVLKLGQTSFGKAHSWVGRAGAQNIKKSMEDPGADYTLTS